MTNRMTHATMAVLLLVTTAHICGETAMNTTSSWKPVALKVQAPTRDVTLADGIWRQAFDANVKALLSSFTADDMLNKYRSRKGEATPPGKLPGHMFGAIPHGCWQRTPMVGKCRTARADE
jgi:hypothetical protein